MEYDDSHIDEWIAKAKAGTLTDDELTALLAWYNSFDDSQAVLPAVDGIDADQLKAQLYNRLMERVRSDGATPVKAVRKRYLRLLPYAAAVLLAVAAVAGITHFWGQRGAQPASMEALANDVAPGGNRATLTLADGRTVTLSEAQEGIRVGDAVTYLDGSLVEETATGALPGEEIQMLTLSTPNGGTYQVTLPDGTQVWLNAASTLRYPHKFTGSARVVELAGEAYFAVARVEDTAVADAKAAYLPFRVVSHGQEIEVLGTEFNVSAYPDEPEAHTTLVSGKVNVHAAGTQAVLEPGQQATVGAEGMRVRAVEPAPHIAWKNGRFHFQRTPLEEIMKQISRWYDVEVVYAQGIPQETFSGKVRRDVSLMGVLNILQASTIDIKLKGKTLVIN